MVNHPSFFDPARPTILLIEDEADVRQGLATLLGDRYNVLEAGSGQEAIQLYEQYQMNLSLVMLDIRLPDMSGLEILKALRAINVNPDIIMATAIKDQTSAIQAMQDGAVDYLVKPFLAADVQAAIKRVIDKQDFRRKIREVKEMAEKSAILAERRDILAQEIEMKKKLSGQQIDPLERYSFVDNLAANYSYQQIVELLEKDLKEKTYSDSGPGRARVLIVEDEPDIQASLKDVLSDRYLVSQALNGRQALETIKKESFDVVLLDIRLPDLTGLEVLQALTKDPPPHLEEISIIMTTALKDIQSAVEAFRYGAYDYLTKPIRVDDIRRSIQRALDNKNHKKLLRQLLEKLRTAKTAPEKRRSLLDEFVARQRQKNLPVTLGDVLAFFPEYYTGDFDARLVLPPDLSIPDIIEKIAGSYQKKQAEATQGLDLPPEVPDYIRKLLQEQSGKKQ